VEIQKQAAESLTAEVTVLSDEISGVVQHHQKRGDPASEFESAKFGRGWGESCLALRLGRRVQGHLDWLPIERAPRAQPIDRQRRKGRDRAIGAGKLL